MTDVADRSVDLVVTSPPYPMIEMWDNLFADRDSEVREALDAGDGDAAFERMHAQLDAVWDEVARVLAPGGIACINVGDAVRSLAGRFQQFPNHARVIDALTERGLHSLPDILWRKPTNRLTKFMGSGMLPPSAYVALEHEYILVFRKGDTREFPRGDPERYESAFFWEERNEWFSDLWSFTGTDQTLPTDGPAAAAGEGGGSDSRGRSAAFPLELPLRLVRMYSSYGDTVLDPFAGTGTTTLAAMHAGRDSVGYELDAELVRGFGDRLTDLPAVSQQRTRERLARHRAAVADRDTSYEAAHYDVPVVTKQERQIRLYGVADVDSTDSSPADGDDGTVGYRVEHTPIEELVDLGAAADDDD